MKYLRLEKYNLRFQILAAKKAGAVFISVYLSCNAEDFKTMLWYVRDLELAKYNTLQSFQKSKAISQA